MPQTRSLVAAALVLVTAGSLAVTHPASALGQPSSNAVSLPSGVTVSDVAQARKSAPVVLNGAQIAGWAQPAAVGVAAPYPSGISDETGNGAPALPGEGLRSAHNGTIEVPPNVPGVPDINPSQVAAYTWTSTGWQQVPVQVDEMYPNFLANGRSSFGIYSGTDTELTYAWAHDAHDVGAESWKRLFPSPLVDPAPANGACLSRFARSIKEVNAAIDAGLITLGAGETAADYLSSASDPQKWFDTDDQLSFMASDAGGQAPIGQAPPSGATNAQTVTVVDPVTQVTRYVYLFTQPGGSAFTARTGYVHMTPNVGSGKWIDRYSFAKGAPDAIGLSNGGYGPNLPEWVCDTAPGNDGGYPAGNAARASTDANPRDNFTVSTPTYQIRTAGRWLVNGLHVAGPGTPGRYGSNVIARWKGRAFQQSPDSSVSLVGFEDEQVNWEMNSSLLGWRSGPVRAIREVWGADSGTNTTKTEFYYRDADVFNYHLRVHPIPPDGLYTDWDYRPGVATNYYNLKTPGGVAIDGQADNVGEIDKVGDQNVETNVCDPSFAICSAVDNPEEVAGKGFGLVYEF
ncbi:MAG: hypothetical protein JO246_11920, partial [Frankiaceae bacterium]|nr:hypothetical protein [Frankiaceae bacterium]